jgi:hypothetical protein
MIRHIVFFSLKAETSPEAAIARLSDLGTIPGSTAFEVRRNLKVDQFANEIDLVVYGEFPDVETLLAYKRHPTYEAVTRDVRPTRELRFAADIEG